MAARARAASLRVARGADSARSVGDEPLLLARVAPCYVGPDRVASARLAIEDGASVLVMDDGLQNPALAKTLTRGGGRRRSAVRQRPLPARRPAARAGRRATAVSSTRW